MLKCMCMKNPYNKFTNSKLWQVISNALDDLIKNQDIKERTNKEYVIGYLCKKIIESKIIAISGVKIIKSRSVK